MSITTTQALPPTIAAATIAAHNKRLMRAVFDALAAGDPTPYHDHLADDVRYTVLGTTTWSRIYFGKQTAVDQLLRPLYRAYGGGFTSTAHRIIADGDHVVVESRGRATTTAGAPYNNTCCQVFRLANQKILEVTEYCDTALMAAVL